MRTQRGHRDKTIKTVPAGVLHFPKPSRHSSSHKTGHSSKFNAYRSQAVDTHTNTRSTPMSTSDEYRHRSILRGHSIPPEQRRRIGRQRDARVVGVVVEVQRHAGGGSRSSRGGGRAAVVRVHRLRVGADAGRRLRNAGSRCYGGGGCRDDRVRPGGRNGAGQRRHGVVS